MPDQLIPISLSMEGKTGTVRALAAFINGQLLFAGEGQKRKGEAQVPDAPVLVKGRAWGIGGATYELNIDLPGTSRDAKLTFALKGGYHEFSMEI